MRDPFMFTGMKDMATIGQTFVQNEVMSSNEVRSKIGLKPRDTERANELLNKNINKVEDYNEMKSKLNPVDELVENGKRIQNELETTNDVEEDKDG